MAQKISKRGLFGLVLGAAAAPLVPKTEMTWTAVEYPFTEVSTSFYVSDADAQWLEGSIQRAVEENNALVRFWKASSDA